MKHKLPLLTLLIALFVNLAVNAQNETRLSFKSGTFTLYGTLTTPSGTGPFPVAVFVHGSGPQDRDQTIVLNDANSQCLYPGLYGDTVKNFRDIAHGLAKHGIATFRYDKITYTHAASIDQKNFSPYDLIKNVSDAVDFVKTRSEVDVNKIYLLGHSKGVNFISILAGRRNDIKALIALAGAAKGIDSIVADQVRYIYKTCADSVQGEAAAKQVEDVFRQVRNGTWDPNTPIMGAYPKFWKDWIGITDSAIIHYNKINTPVLFLQGTNDFNVPVYNAQRYEAQVKRNIVNVYYLNGLNHFFTTVTNPAVPAYVTDTIANWLFKNGLSTGIKENKQAVANNYLEVRYNTSGKEIYITINKNKHFQSLELLDINGKIVQRFNVKNTTNFVIESGKFPAGIYLLKGISDNTELYQKIVLQ